MDNSDRSQRPINRLYDDMTGRFIPELKTAA